MLGSVYQRVGDLPLRTWIMVNKGNHPLSQDVRKVVTYCNLARWMKMMINQWNFKCLLEVSEKSKEIQMTMGRTAAKRVFFHHLQDKNGIFIWGWTPMSIRMPWSQVGEYPQRISKNDLSNRRHVSTCFHMFPQGGTPQWCECWFIIPIKTSSIYHL